MNLAGRACVGIDAAVGQGRDERLDGRVEDEDGEDDERGRGEQDAGAQVARLDGLLVLLGDLVRFALRRCCGHFAPPKGHMIGCREWKRSPSLSGIGWEGERRSAAVSYAWGWVAGCRSLLGVLVEVARDGALGLVEQTLDVVAGADSVLGQGVEGGGDVAEAALEAGDADVGVVGVLRVLGDQRTVGQLIGGDGLVVRRVGGIRGTTSPGCRGCCRT